MGFVVAGDVLNSYYKPQCIQLDKERFYVSRKISFIHIRYKTLFRKLVQSRVGAFHAYCLNYRLICMNGQRTAISSSIKVFNQSELRYVNYLHKIGHVVVAYPPSISLPL